MITSKADRDRIRQMAALGRKRTVKPPKIEKMCEHEVWIWNRYLADVDSVMRREFLKSEGINQGTWVCVYFARMGNTTAHKIGFAVHADSRIKQLQTSSPVPVKIAAWINAPCRDWLPIVEREAHQQAAKYGKRLKGEWFDLHPEALRRVIDGVVAAIPLQVSGVNYEM